MLGCEVEDMLMGRIAQECAALHAVMQGLGEVWDVTPLSDEPADLEAPVGIEIIDDPIIALHRRQLLHDVREMGGPIRTGTRLAEIPHQCARRDDEGGQQRACTMADVLMLALFRFPRLHWLGRVRTL